MQFISKYRLDHIAFWLITVAFYALIRTNIISAAGPALYLADVVVHNLLLIAICYFNIYVLFEVLFRKGKTFWYLGSILLLMIAYTLSQNAFDTWLSRHYHEAGYRRSFFFNTYYNGSIGIFYLAFTLSLELSKRWYRQQLQMHQIKAEKLKTELEYLKAQLNPHFLFNSINTIYFQIDPSNKEARQSLERFSELLRYQLYECNEDQIPIEKELGYLESYVELQRLRKSDKHSIVFDCDKNTRDFKIAPLLLLPFVENAFKHLSTSTKNLNQVEVNLARENGSFTFNVSNTIDENPEDEMNQSLSISNHYRQNATRSSGIGLKNVQRRLDLIYDGQYTLNISKTAGSFNVNLQINVA